MLCLRPICQADVSICAASVQAPLCPGDEEFPKEAGAHGMGHVVFHAGPALPGIVLPVPCPTHTADTKVLTPAFCLSGADLPPLVVSSDNDGCKAKVV